MNDTSEALARRGRRKLLLVAVIFMAPLLLAIGWYKLAPRFVPGSAAHGTLVDPARPIEPFAVPAVNGGRYTLDDLRDHWSLVHVIGDRCDPACRQRLYDTRQAHAALGKDAIRVQRLALTSDGRQTPGLAEILDRHPDLTVLTMPRDTPFAGQLQTNPPSGTVFVIDPHANLMMRYAPDVSASDMLDDLKRLLKLSQIG